MYILWPNVGLFYEFGMENVRMFEFFHLEFSLRTKHFDFYTKNPYSMKTLELTN